MSRMTAFAGLCLATFAVAQQTPPVFPMQKGTTWTYQAHVKAEQPHSSQILEKNLRWTMRAEESVTNSDISAVLLRGGPWDLAWYEPGVQPGSHAVVRVGNAYYLLHGNDATAVMAQVKQGRIADPEELFAEDLWFRTPLHAGDKFCDPQMESQAPMYCWSVESAVVDPHSGRTQYQLAYRTWPDHEIVTLVPGTGIVAWEYAHHGSKAEASLKLVEFRAPPGTGVSRKPLASKQVGH